MQRPFVLLRRPLRGRQNLHRWLLSPRFPKTAAVCRAQPVAAWTFARSAAGSSAAAGCTATAGGTAAAGSTAAAAAAALDIRADAGPYEVVVGVRLIINITTIMSFAQIVITDVVGLCCCGM